MKTIPQLANRVKAMFPYFGWWHLSSGELREFNSRCKKLLGHTAIVIENEDTHSTRLTAVYWRTPDQRYGVSSIADYSILKAEPGVIPEAILNGATGYSVNDVYFVLRENRYKQKTVDQLKLCIEDWERKFTVLPFKNSSQFASHMGVNKSQIANGRWLDSEGKPKPEYDFFWFDGKMILCDTSHASYIANRRK